MQQEFKMLRTLFMHMYPVITLKSTFKQVFNPGLAPLPTGDTTLPTGDIPVDFEKDVRTVSDQEWLTFERHEGTYRRGLDTKLLQVRNNFAVSPGSAEKWGSLVSILMVAFYKNGIFCATQRNGHPYGYSFLKYVIRILKTFPLCDGYPVELTSGSLTSRIEKQLFFIREQIQPALCATESQAHRQQNEVTRNKLA